MPHRDRLVRLVELLFVLLLDGPLDVADDRLRLLLATVDEEPARTLRHVSANDENAQTDHGAEQEREAPADARGEQRLVEQQDRNSRAEGGADPVGAVDDQIDAAAHPRRDQLVDRRVDRRVLAADARAGEEAGDAEGQERGGERRRQRRHDVQRERDHEELLAAQPVGQPVQAPPT